MHKKIQNPFIINQNLFSKKKNTSSEIISQAFALNPRYNPAHLRSHWWYANEHSKGSWVAPKYYFTHRFLYNYTLDCKSNIWDTSIVFYNRITMKYF